MVELATGYHIPTPGLPPPPMPPKKVVCSLIIGERALSSIAEEIRFLKKQGEKTEEEAGEVTLLFLTYRSLPLFPPSTTDACTIHRSRKKLHWLLLKWRQLTRCVHYIVTFAMGAAGLCASLGFWHFSQTHWPKSLLPTVIVIDSQTGLLQHEDFMTSLEPFTAFKRNSYEDHLPTLVLIAIVIFLAGWTWWFRIVGLGTWHQKTWSGLLIWWRIVWSRSKSGDIQLRHC